MRKHKGCCGSRDIVFDITLFAVAPFRTNSCDNSFRRVADCCGRFHFFGRLSVAALSVSTGWLSKRACFARATSGDSFRGREIRTQIRTCYCEQVSTEAVRLLGPIDLGRTNRKRILSDSTMPDETSEPKPTEKKRERTVRDLKPKIDPKGGAANGGKSDKATRRTEEVDFDWTLRS
jgi:hypothetical protein